MYKHILIPTDGSTASARAAKAGIKLAASVGARVTAFFAAPTPTPVIYDGVLPVGYMSPDQHAELIERAASVFDVHGADAWYERPLEEFVAAGTACRACGGASFERIAALMQGRFEFNGETHALGDTPDWLSNPSRDVEWHILLHKFYYATGLGMAWADTDSTTSPRSSTTGIGA